MRDASSNAPGDPKLQIEIILVEGPPRYFLAEPKKEPSHSNGDTVRVTWKGKNSKVRVLDVEAQSGGTLSGKRCQSGQCSADLDVTAGEFIYQVLVETDDFGPCLAYGGPPSDEPKCFDSIPTVLPVVGTPHPPPKIDPPVLLKGKR